MKKYFAYIAFAALVFAVSCNKEEINTTVETELITVEINPEVKTSLSGVNTEWTAGDAVSVTVAGKNIGTLTLVDGNTFSGEIEAGHDGDATLNYPAGVTEVPATQAAVANSFANGAALLEGTTTMDALRAGEGATLLNKTALLCFKPYVAGDVVFTIGSISYTIKDCTSGTTYFACVSPVSGASLSYTLGGDEGAKAKDNVAFEAGKIYNLGELKIKTYVYLVPNVNWQNENAKFAAYFYVDDNNNTWVEMTKSSAGVYTCAVPDGYPNVIFCRMDPSKAITAGWGAKWDQTNNLTVPTGNKNYYYIEGWSKSNASKWDTSAYTSTYFPSSDKRYLLPQEEWAQNNERYAAYFFEGNSNKWVNLSKVSGCKYLTGSYYEVAVQSGYSNMIFCRMNKSTTDNTWNNKWDQTKDLSVNGGELYTVSKKSNSQKESWSKFSY